MLAKLGLVFVRGHRLVTRLIRVVPEAVLMGLGAEVQGCDCRALLVSLRGTLVEDVAA